MFELIENIKLLIQNKDKVALAVLFIAICHMIPIVIEYFKREKEEKIVCVVDFKLFVKGKRPIIGRLRCKRDNQHIMQI